jgi:hypothetical protein
MTDRTQWTVPTQLRRRAAEPPEDIAHRRIGEDLTVGRRDSAPTAATRAPVPKVGRVAVVADLPRNALGKIDRKQLRKDFEREITSRDFEPPGTSTESYPAELWAGPPDVDRGSVTEDFRQPNDPVAGPRPQLVPTFD